MTVFTLQAPMPMIRLLPGMKLKLEAINPTTGQAVAGVSASEWTIYGVDALEAGAGGDLSSGPFMLVPGLPDVSSAPLTFTGGL